MKTLKLNIVKKNRVWAECVNESGYTVKLKMDQNVQDLEIGLQELILNDISVRSKYGTDVRYELVQKKSNENIFLKAEKNLDMISECKRLGGKWDSEEGVWIFDKMLADKVEELEYLYASEMIPVEITAKDCIKDDLLEFLGYQIAYVSGRDSGAKLCEGVSLLDGGISSGGSMKNWYGHIYRGTVLRLKVSKPLLDVIKNSHSEFDITILKV